MKANVRGQRASLTELHQRQRTVRILRDNTVPSVSLRFVSSSSDDDWDMLGTQGLPCKKSPEADTFLLWLSFVLPVNVPRSKGKGVAVISPKELCIPEPVPLSPGSTKALLPHPFHSSRTWVSKLTFISRYPQMNPILLPLLIQASALHFGKARWGH